MKSLGEKVFDAMVEADHRKPGAFIVDDHEIVVVAGTSVRDKIFEFYALGALAEPDGSGGVWFVTDSIEALKVLMSRGFPLEELVNELIGNSKKMPSKAEFIVPIFVGNSDQDLKLETSKLRFVRRMKRNLAFEFEVRIIK